MPILTQLRDAARKRATYRRTLAELRAMPLDVALDLGIERENARNIARNAVYGDGR